MPKWRNWQTRTFEGRVRQLVGVRVPPSAPSRLFSTSYVHFSALYINVCLVSIDYDSLGRGDSDFRTRSKIESSREGHFCGAILVTRPIVTAQRILSPLFALSTTFCYMIPGSIYRRLSRQSKLTSQKVSQRNSLIFPSSRKPKSFQREHLLHLLVRSQVD